MSSVRALLLLACLLLLPTPIVYGEAPPPPLPWQLGPLDLPLANQAVLHLPAGYRFLGPEPTQAILRQMGNYPSGEELGLITSTEPHEEWFTVLRYLNAGYVKDDDAANWNADDLFAAIKEGTEHDNEQRKAQGFPLLILKGWAQQPRYDATAHKVEWAISSESEAHTGVNYNTLALGRYGYLSMNMVGSLEELPNMKPHAKALLSHLDFDEGKRYADFNSATDKVAAVGLAALIAGAAFKTGLLAKLWAFIVPLLLLGKKLIILIIIGAGALLTRFFKKKPAMATAPANEPPPTV